MSGLNLIVLVGNVGDEPEIRTTNSGKKVATVSLATNHYAGGKQETAWHRVIFWEEKAELIEKYVHKGTGLVVTGRVRYRTYEDKNKATRYVTEIQGYTLDFVGGKDKRETPQEEQAEVPF